MTMDDFERHVKELGLVVGRLAVGDRTYLHIKGVTIGGGTHAGAACEVAILRSAEQPWAPEAAVHVRPPLVPMGQMASQASPLGSDWQYLSRRFDRVPTPRGFLAHVLTVLAEV